MSGEVIYVIVVLVVSVLGVVLVGRYTGKKKRREDADIQAFAASQGLSLEPPDKPVQMHGLRLLERGGTSRTPMQYMSAPGSNNVVFYYLAYTSGADSGSSQRDICALVDLPFGAPSMTLSRKKPTRRSGDKAPEKVPTGDAAFDDQFWLTSTDAPAAQRIFTPAVAREVADRLAQAPDVELELNSNRMIAVVKAPMTAAERWELLQWTEGMAELLGRHRQAD